ncbi:hypothetical protein AB0885_44960, partial [Streptomyces sp. NPDC005534]
MRTPDPGPSGGSGGPVTSRTDRALLVPYYEHPSVRPAEWDALLAAAPRLYGVVLNPGSGPGEHPDPAFAAVAARLRAARCLYSPRATSTTKRSYLANSARTSTGRPACS